jgi:hypothetical protein
LHITELFNEVPGVCETNEGLWVAFDKDGHELGIEPGKAVRFVHFKEVCDVAFDVVGGVDPGIGEELTFFELAEGIETRLGGGMGLLCGRFMTVSTGVAAGAGEDTVVSGLSKVSIDCVWMGVSSSECIKLGSSECIRLASIDGVVTGMC